MFEYAAKVAKPIHDGDTVWLEVDLGFGLKFVESFRLLGINAPELRTPTGPAARDYLRALIDGQPLTVKTAKDKKEKYGRYLATIFLPDGTNVNEKMVEAGHAVRY